MTSSGAAEVWVKLEGANPTGSYKDRMALAMVEAVEKSGELTAGTSLLECTGGSTGSSLAFVCAVKGHRFTVISSDAYARWREDVKLNTTPPAMGGLTQPPSSISTRA